MNPNTHYENHGCILSYLLNVYQADLHIRRKSKYSTRCCTKENMLFEVEVQMG